MNEIVTNNLFEFWEFIGKKNNCYSETANYKSVYVVGSDWPKRVYAIEDKIENYDEIISLSTQHLLPNIITIHKHTDLLNGKNVQLSLSQVNMSLEVRHYTSRAHTNENIYQVNTASEANEFANIASESFGYKVDSRIVFSLCNDGNCKLFFYRENKECYGCGIIFFDSNNIAGFHLIGTVPGARGKGIGKSITERLIDEALLNNSPYCVLNASTMGEPIYRKLGFISFGLLEHYTILQ